MNRRNFIAALAALPSLAVVGKAKVAQIQEPPISQTACGNEIWTHYDDGRVIHRVVFKSVPTGPLDSGGYLTCLPNDLNNPMTYLRKPDVCYEVSNGCWFRDSEFEPHPFRLWLVKLENERGDAIYESAVY